jgi:uncharacterized protein YybS (DUF2232 family)
VSLLIVILSLLLLVVSALSFYKWGYKALAAMAPLMILVLFKGLATTNIVMFLGGSIIIGSFAGVTFAQRKTFQFFLVLATLAFSLLTISHYFYRIEFQNIDMAEQIVKDGKEVFVRNIETLPQFIDLSEQEKESVIQLAQNIYKLLFPFNLFLSCFLLTIFGYFLLKVIFDLFIVKKSLQIKGLEYFKLNDYVIFGLIVSLGLLTLSIYVKTGVLNYIALNGVLIFSLLYFVQALGVLRFFLIKKKWPTMFLPIGLFLLLIVLGPTFVLVYVMMAGWGALDLWTDFRKLNNKDNKNQNTHSTTE